MRRATRGEMSTAKQIKALTGFHHVADADVYELLAFDGLDSPVELVTQYYPCDLFCRWR